MKFSAVFCFFFSANYSTYACLNPSFYQFVASGASLIFAASFTAVSLYYPGAQLAPYAALMMLYMLGVTVSPPWIG